MSDKLFITNRVPDGTFAQTALSKYPTKYFTKNGWVTKYITDKWDKDLDKYKVIFLWCIQELVEERHMKKPCLLKLLRKQSKHKFIILDYVEDLHQVYKFFGIERDIYLKNFKKKQSKNYIITRYANVFDRYYPKCNHHVLPYSIPAKMIPKFNHKPINRLLLTGSLSAAYPKRISIAELKFEYPIDVLEHPSYRTLKHLYIGRNYYKKLNEYKASVATCASPKFNYIVAKYFEIPASGALLFAYIDPIKTELYKYGFEDMKNMISFDDDNLKERIQYILNENNESQINKIRKAGYDLINEKHTHKIRFNDFDKFIIKIQKNIKK